MTAYINVMSTKKHTLNRFDETKHTMQFKWQNRITRTKQKKIICKAFNIHVNNEKLKKILTNLVHVIYLFRFVYCSYLKNFVEKSFDYFIARIYLWT